MWRSATSSDRSLTACRPRRPLVAAFGALSLLAVSAAFGRVLLSTEEALHLAFPEARIERTTVYLTATQRARAIELAGSAPASSILHPYVAFAGEELVGTAYFDTHRVRTLSETVMVVVNAESKVGRVEVLAFDEPPDYLPRGEWYRQFDGKPLSERLAIAGEIRGVTGATLTAHATANAVRRVLALHAAIRGEGALGEAEKGR